MINRNDFQSMLVNLDKPQGILTSFMNYLRVNGASYNQAKTLAVFAQDSKKAVTSLSSVNFTYGNGTSGQFPESEHFLILGIRILTGTGANVDTTAYTPGVSDANVQNGKISITNNGSVVIKEMPLTMFPLSTGNADTDSGMIVLSKPILWQGQTTLTATLSQDNPTAVADTNVNIQLIGLKLI